MIWNVWARALKENEEWLQREGFPRYRAKQIHHYLYNQSIHSFSDMVQLPKTMREWLQDHGVIEKPLQLRRLETSDGRTMKLLLKLSDNSLVETVCMHQPYGNSICVSTQVGCAMGCIFCASTCQGRERNLTAEEMLSQVYAFFDEGVKDVHSIVLMGSGEPLDNYEEVLRFIHLCHEEEPLALSYRNITLSTVGIVPQIYRLAEEDLPITLAISLHAPNDKIRNYIVPASRRFPLPDLIKAADFYFQRSHRRVSFEYILIRGINDSPENVRELSALVKNLNCHINLIPVNGTDHIHLFAPGKEAVQKFHDVLAASGKSVTIRRQMGDEIQAACGQLKKRQVETAEIDVPPAK